MTPRTKAALVVAWTAIIGAIALTCTGDLENALLAVMVGAGALILVTIWHDRA